MSHTYLTTEELATRMKYDARTSKRAFKAMYNLLDEVFKD